MKKMKKLFAMLIAMVMVLGMSMSAFAATVEVKEVIDGEQYTAYKILNYSDNGKTGDERAVSYYLSDTEYTQIGSVLEAAGLLSQLLLMESSIQLIMLKQLMLLEQQHT